MTHALATREPNVTGGLEVEAVDGDSRNPIGEMEADGATG